MALPPKPAAPGARTLSQPSSVALACFERGQSLRRQGQSAEAVLCYQSALALAPRALSLWSQVGEAFLALGLPRKAVFCYRFIAERAPRLSEAQACLGSALRACGEFDEAVACFRRALALKPASADAQNNLGLALRDLGRVEEAMACYRAAMALEPEHIDARWNLGLAQLLTGDFLEGWRNYEMRWQREDAPCRFAEPLWRGQPLHGARILLHAEQGLGDNLQFLRFVPQVEAAGGRVILGLPPRQRALAAGLVGLSHVEFVTLPPQPFDWHCPLMSLPLALGTTLATLPAHAPYLTVPVEARQRTAALDWPTQGLRVGLVWSGTPEHPQNRFRAVPLALLEPLWALDNVRFFSLQMGPPAAELAAGQRPIVDLAPVTHAMEDTAAQMLELDLILAVDTMVAHLAGALGRPVWLLLAANHDWRWMREREDSPWYPTMRLFRQPKMGDWRSVVARVRKELIVLAKNRAER
jgi:hypothetical protein